MDDQNAVHGEHHSGPTLRGPPAAVGSFALRPDPSFFDSVSYAWIDPVWRS